ncbi:MAG TPA: ABC transporter ATP-binding protein [Streptosporangiaceae bacterium]|nr:ABC transporter ATP-binding protein [Streptosporangiaceae bacterium]
MTAPAGLDPTVSESPLLEARGLTKHFPVRGATNGRRGGIVHAVDDVSLVVPSAGITAIVGESGSGKSTLARMLARLIKPTSGELLLDGQTSTAALGGVRREYARAVQLVLQDPFSSLNPVHDVRYHLARPLKVHKLASGSLDEAIDGLLARVSLTPAANFTGKYPHELSGGQRQRVAIARALAVAPRLLLADEPVSMLDVSIRLGVLNLLADLREKDGLAIVYVTHDIASARYLADVVAVMYAGRVVEIGPAAAVTSEPAHPYTELLLSAAPDPGRARSVPARARTAPPNLVTPPPGCRFHPRCPHAMRVCTSGVPEMTQISPGHHSACWLHVNGLDTQQRTPLVSKPGKEA